MPPGDSKTIQVTENQNINVGLSVGNALLVTLAGSTFTGNVDFKSTIDGENYSNHPYIQYHVAAPSRSVAQIVDPSTATSYVILPPATQLQIAVTGVSAGSLTVRYAEINFNFADPTAGLTTVDLGEDVTGQLPIANGGTAAADAATARSNLGLAIGSDVQAYSANLAAIAALAVTDGNMIVGNGSTWVAESGATLRSSIGVDAAGTDNSTDVTLVTTSHDYLSIAGQAITLGPIDLAADVTGDLPVAEGGTGSSTAAGARTNLGVAIGSDVQAYDAGLAAIAALAVTDGNIIVGNGSTWVAESGATARASLGVDAAGTDNSTDVTLSGSYDYITISGQVITVGQVDLAADVTGTLPVSAFDLSTLTDMTVAVDGSVDELVVLDAGVQKRKRFAEIGLSEFNDDLGAGGDITGVTAGTLLDGGGTTGDVTLDVDLSELSTSVADGDGDYFVVVDSVNAQRKLTKANINLSGFNNDSGFLTTVDLTSDVTGDLPVAEGGTGSSTAAGARTNLGLAIGSDVQAYDAELAAIAALAVTDGNIIVGNGSTWVAESGATARTSLGVSIGSDVQAYDAGLAAIAGLAVTDGNFIVGNGSTWVAESGATARTSLGLGSLATASTINNGDWSGTDLSVANGGTGVSTLADHGVLLGSGTAAVTVTGAGTSGQVLTSNGASSDPTFQDAGGTEVATGSYTGDGNTTQAITGVGFQPKYVHILRNGQQPIETYADFIDLDVTDGMSIRLAQYSNTDYIRSLDADGFTVGDNIIANSNANTETYYYIAIG